MQTQPERRVAARKSTDAPSSTRVGRAQIDSSEVAPLTEDEARGVTGAWMLLAVGDQRQHGGNAGYDDDVEACYRWDSSVPNHGKVRMGDVVAIWDKSYLIGTAIVGRIDHGQSEKTVFRCAECGQSNIKQRKTKSPLYRCFDCSSEFDHPVAKQIEVKTYAADYRATWRTSDELVTASALRRMAVSPSAQNSIRQLDWDKFSSQTMSSTAAVETAARSNAIAGGHVLRMARTRVGQEAFRRKLLKAYGDTCALTGRCPTAALEAAHLYSYATTGEHRDDGGLLLRRDAHRLFDAGVIAVRPGSLLIDVDSSASAYAAYGPLHGAPLNVDVTARQRSWLSDHWSQHRR